MDWPISWQKVKDSSGNTGGGSGSGLPVIDLSKYVLVYGSAESTMAAITDPTDIAALAELNGMPFVGKFTQARDIGGDSPFMETYTMVMSYSYGYDFKGYAGSLASSTAIAILSGDGDAYMIMITNP